MGRATRFDVSAAQLVGGGGEAGANIRPTLSRTAKALRGELGRRRPQWRPGALRSGERAAFSAPRRERARSAGGHSVPQEAS